MRAYTALKLAGIKSGQRVSASPIIKSIAQSVCFFISAKTDTTPADPRKQGKKVSAAR
jgi:hypothetical protein